MKYLFILAFSICATFCLSAQNDQDHSVTTYYLVRHAEKDTSDKTNKNPNLTSEGISRAKNWSNVFQHIPFDAVYSTNYNRTLQTATPTAEAQSIDIEIYDPRSLKIDEFKEITKGKTVLIVGHSNTTPMLVNAILGAQKYEDMAHDDNGSLYIITISNGQKTDQILTIN